MERPEAQGESDALQRRKSAEALLDAMFARSGWRILRGPGDDAGVDLLVRRSGIEYAVTLKAAPEGRSDRLVPLFAQAVLEATHGAPEGAKPLAVVAAPRITRRVADQVIGFAEEFAPGASAGVVDSQGLRRFRGLHLEELNAEAEASAVAAPRAIGVSGHLFSDLNQWMLKVLLAPELPERLLSAPRGQYRNASQLARNANVSVMSAFRLVRQLQHEGYLHESSPYLSLVRREDLFNRWQALAARSAREVPMRFVLPGDPRSELEKLLGSGRSCVALFAAADALRLGFVHGVPPYVYVERVQPVTLAAWKNLRLCAPGEPPDVIVRQAPAQQSVFRGAVQTNGIAACDVLQVWVDVASHPSRGREQADLIRRRALQRVIEGGR